MFLKYICGSSFSTVLLRCFTIFTRTCHSSKETVNRSWDQFLICRITRLLEMYVLHSCEQGVCLVLIMAVQVWNPPDTESTYGFNYDNCEAKTAPGILYLVKW
jgi:hypothetical protein